jgi:hypothetical protein
VQSQRSHVARTGCVRSGSSECYSTCTSHSYLHVHLLKPLCRLSQLIGSTLALQYLRAGQCLLNAVSFPAHSYCGYVVQNTSHRSARHRSSSTSSSPGSSSARPSRALTSTWVPAPPLRIAFHACAAQGTVVVILGVVGIVAFGSWNSGLIPLADAARLATLWTRAGWLAFFLVAACTLVGVYVFVATLEAVLAARTDLHGVPFAARRRASPARARSWIRRTKDRVDGWGDALGARLETWTADRPDAHVAWTLGIGWACAGGGLAGFTLVFAKASYALNTTFAEVPADHDNAGSHWLPQAARSSRTPRACSRSSSLA